jgi:hypothetical protein
MKSWIFAFVGLTSLLASFTVPALAQQGTKADPPKAEQRSSKEVKFKLEWITSVKSKTSPFEEKYSLSVVGVDGETTMTNNSDGTSSSYRRVTLHPESQKDGSYLVDLTISDSSQDRDIPRIATTVKIFPGINKLVQARLMNGKDTDADYQLFLTVEKE